MVSATSQDIRYYGASRVLGASEVVRPGGAPLSLYWARPAAGEALAGVGIAASLTAVNGPEGVQAALGAQVAWDGGAPDVPGPWFGGFAFDAERSPSTEWAGFGGATFVLPRSAVAVRNGRRMALGFGTSPEEAARALEEAEALASAVHAESSRGAPFTLHEDRPAWDALVESALDVIRSGTAEKIVAARRVRVTSKAPLLAEAIAARLLDAEPTSTTFLIRGRDGSAFVGATPETLLRCERDLLHVDALAGTLPADGSATPDDKILREHHVVVDGIVRALSGLPAVVEAEAVPKLMGLRHVRHLHTPIVARLHPSRTVADAVRALHPTPATGGAPRDAALLFLRQHEGFDRGWYAGGVGYVGKESAHLCVALRSALVDADGAWAYAGAGLVRGSVASAEWDETSRKLRTVLSAIGEAA